MELRESMAVDLESMRRKFGRWKKSSTGREPAQGEFFEEYVRYMYESLLTAQAGAVMVRRNALVTDNIGADYRVDVLYEFDVAGITHRVAIECKDSDRRIDRDEVIAFEGKLRHMSNTIGVFVSRGGFQAGATQFLDQYGIEHLDGAQIPDFGRLVAARLLPSILPSKSAIGQPFWGLMNIADGEIDGTWLRLPGRDFDSTSPAPQPQESFFALFTSFRHAQLFCDALAQSSHGVAVRGIEQPMLRVITTIGREQGQRFALAETIEQDGRTQLLLQEIAVDVVIDDYLVPR